MKKRLKTLIIGLILLSISPLPHAAWAGDILMEGERAPYGGFIFKRDEVDKFQIMRHEMDLLEKKYEEKLAEYQEPRSPRMAALFSLVMPGSGQLFYSEDYTKGKYMLGTELVLIAGALFFSYQADTQMASYASSRKASDFNAATDSKNTRDMIFYGVVALGLYSAFDAWTGVNRFNKKFENKEETAYRIGFDGEIVAMNYSVRF